MRTLSRFALLQTIAATALVATIAIAAPPADLSHPPKADVPPPPGMNDPGVTAATPQAQQAPGDAASPNADPLAPLPKPDTRLVRDRADRDPEVQRRMAASEHVTRAQGDDTHGSRSPDTYLDWHLSPIIRMIISIIRTHRREVIVGASTPKSPPTRRASTKPRSPSASPSRRSGAGGAGRRRRGPCRRADR